MKFVRSLIIIIGIFGSLMARDNNFAKVYNADTSPPKFLYYHYTVDKNRGDQEILTHYYLLPDSTEAVVEEAVLYDGKLKEYTSNFYILNEQSKLSIDGDKLDITYTKDGKTKSKTVKLEETLLVGPLFIDYLVENWNKLLDGKTVKFRLPVADMLTTAGFYLKKDDSSEFERSEERRGGKEC